jgi:hypothetical protein
MASDGRRSFLADTIALILFFTTGLLPVLWTVS